MAAILVVEDQTELLHLLRRLLQLDMHEVTTATDGDVALDLLRSGLQCDVVITDWYMPRMCGDVLASTLFADSQLAHLPIILFSSKATDGLPENVISRVPKPLDVPDLLAQVARAVAPVSAMTGLKSAANGTQ